MAQLHARRSLEALSAVISRSGLCACASSVRRQFSQSAGGGLWSVASLTGMKSVTCAGAGDNVSSRAAAVNPSRRIMGTPSHTGSVPARYVHRTR